MSDGQEIVVLEQKSVFFLNDELIAVRADDKQVYVSLRHLCQALGLNRTGQMQRIRRHVVLIEGYKNAEVEIPNAGHPQQAGMLRVDLVPMWLSGVDVRRVKEEIKDKLIQYQKEAAKVLWEAFQEGQLTADLSFSDLLQQADNDAVQAYQIAQAIMKLARHQILMQSQLQSHEQRLEQIEAVLGDPGRHVTPDQASQISQAVKAIAMELSKQTKTNAYGGVYGELYRRFGITSYKQLPAAKYNGAMSWLSEWYQQLTDKALPF